MANPNASKTKLFVGHLPEMFTTKQLADLFSLCGTVEECDVINRYGFVHMSTSEEAQNALETLHKWTLNGSQITVERSTSKLCTKPGEAAARARPMSTPTKSARGRGYIKNGYPAQQWNDGRRQYQEPIESSPTNSFYSDNARVGQFQAILDKSYEPTLTASQQSAFQSPPVVHSQLPPVISHWDSSASCGQQQRNGYDMQQPVSKGGGRTDGYGVQPASRGGQAHGYSMQSINKGGQTDAYSIQPVSKGGVQADRYGMQLVSKGQTNGYGVQPVSKGGRTDGYAAVESCDKTSNNSFYTERTLNWRSDQMPHPVDLNQSALITTAVALSAENLSELYNFPNHVVSPNLFPQQSSIASQNAPQRIWLPTGSFYPQAAPRAVPYNTTPDTGSFYQHPQAAHRSVTYNTTQDCGDRLFGSSVNLTPNQSSTTQQGSRYFY